MSIHLLLDLDGTLVDSSPGIYSSFCFVCDEFGLSHPSPLSFRSLIGPPVQCILQSLYPNLDHDFIERFRCSFRDHYDKNGYKYFSWYPGVVSTLRSLAKESSVCMTIVTNKPTQPSHEIIKTKGLVSAFERIVGIDYLCLRHEGQAFSSKADALYYVLNTSSFALHEAIYIGDTLGDKKACEKVGLSFVPVLYGFYQWQSLSGLSRFISSFPDVSCYLKALIDP